jgi:hypothetical protein
MPARVEKPMSEMRQNFVIDALTVQPRKTGFDTVRTMLGASSFALACALSLES